MAELKMEPLLSLPPMRTKIESLELFRQVQPAKLTVVDKEHQPNWAFTVDDVVSGW